MVPRRLRGPRGGLRRWRRRQAPRSPGERLQRRLSRRRSAGAPSRRGSALRLLGRSVGRRSRRPGRWRRLPGRAFRGARRQNAAGNPLTRPQLRRRRRRQIFQRRAAKRGLVVRGAADVPAYRRRRRPTELGHKSFLRRAARRPSHLQVLGRTPRRHHAAGCGERPRLRGHAPAARLGQVEMAKALGRVPRGGAHYAATRLLQRRPHGLRLIRARSRRPAASRGNQYALAFGVRGRLRKARRRRSELRPLWRRRQSRSGPRRSGPALVGRTPCIPRAEGAPGRPVWVLQARRIPPVGRPLRARYPRCDMRRRSNVPVP